MESKGGDKQNEETTSSPFKQQKLPAWQPVFTPKLVIAVFWSVAVAFNIIGSIVLTASSGVVTYSMRYDNLVKFGETASISINIDQDMLPPIFFYYELTNFYQNHRRYVKSRSDAQLRGELDKETSSCEPLEKVDGKILYPCGLIANSFFNDTFEAPKYMTNEGVHTEITWTNKSIAWKSDRDTKFKNVDWTTAKFKKKYTRNRSGVILPLPENEDFIVWMRTAGTPNFKKLNKRIEKNTGLKVIPAGSKFIVNITNQFPVQAFGGTKSVVLSTTCWLGGKNEFLGWAYITVGIICFFLAVIFCVKNIHSHRTPGDGSQLKMNK